jgi:hypothetical protein
VNIIRIDPCRCRVSIVHELSAVRRNIQGISIVSEADLSAQSAISIAHKTR